MIKKFYDSVNIKMGTRMELKDRVKFNRFIFENLFKPKMDECESKGTLLRIDEKDNEFLEEFVKKKVKAKTREWNGKDDKNRFKRETTGSLIEYGLLKFFGKQNQFDDSIVEESYKRNHPDLLPLGVLCDVKGSSMHNVPLVFKSSRTYVCNLGNYRGRRYRCANIIGITDQKSVWLLGVASPRVLEEYTDDNLIMIAENTTKTGFYGVDKLEDLPKEWDVFKKLCSEKSLVL